MPQLRDTLTAHDRERRPRPTGRAHRLGETEKQGRENGDDEGARGTRA